MMQMKNKGGTMLIDVAGNSGKALLNFYKTEQRDDKSANGKIFNTHQAAFQHGTNKGISLPVSAVVILGLAVLVLAAVALLFLTTGGQQISKIEAERIFATKCQELCDRFDSGKNIRTASLLPQNDPFLEACKVKGINFQGEQTALLCLQACPCDTTVTPEQARRLDTCSASCVQGPGFQDCLKACMSID